MKIIRPPKHSIPPTELLPRLTIRLSPKEKEELERVAERTGRTVSELARLAISDLVAESKRGLITLRIDTSEDKPKPTD